MSKKNSKSRRLKQHKAALERDEARVKKMEDKMKEVVERREAGEDEWEDVEESDDDKMREEEVGEKMDVEISGKAIKKPKKKFKIFQKRMVTQEKKRATKARKAGIVVYKKAMNAEKL